MKREIVLTMIFALAGTAASGAEMVTGTWKTQNGETADISRCGPNYCITAKTGKFAGDTLGTFSGQNDSFKGRLTDPQTKTVYSGNLIVTGDTLKLRGCATSVLCKTQTWVRAK